MTKRKITIGELEMAVRIAFDGDEKIYEMYDHSAVVSNIDEIAVDVIRKVKEFEKAELYGVYEKNKIVGYFVCEPLKLISFALTPSFRTRSYLNEFFTMIRKTIKNKFTCFLWSRNIRAVKWLMKNGMEIYDSNPHITTLTYIK